MHPELLHLGALPMRDQIAHMREVIEREYSTRVSRVVEVADAAADPVTGRCRLSRASAATLAILSEFPGATIEHDRLSARLESLIGGDQGPRCIASHIKRLRAGLRDLGWPVRIGCVYGLGYRANWPRSWTPPWDTT